jgi:hypothetical protein
MTEDRKEDKKRKINWVKIVTTIWKLKEPIREGAEFVWEILKPFL